MKKVLLVLMALVAVGIAGEMFLVEEYKEGYVECPDPEQELLEVTFTLDKPAFLLISQSLFYPLNYGYSTGGWFYVNGEKQAFSVSSFNPSYMTEMDSGQVTVQSWAKGGTSSGGKVTKVLNPILQVMVFYPSDEEPSVTEAPPESSDGLSSHSILSSGPSVTVPGCCEVVDVSGRKVDCKIIDDKIMVNSLSSGTYFAKTNDGKTVKITKLQ